MTTPTIHVALVGCYSPVWAAAGRSLWEAGHGVMGCRYEELDSLDLPIDVAMLMPSDQPDEQECRLLEGVVDRLIGRGVGRVVLLSSIEAVGPLGPGEEFVFEGCDESPLTERGRSLLAMEQVVLSRQVPGEFEVVVLRPGQVFNEYGAPWIDDFFDALVAPDAADPWHLGDQRIQPVSQIDLGRSLALAVTRGDWIYHQSDVVTWSLGDLLGLVAELCRNNQVEIPPALQSFPAGQNPGRVHWRFPHHRAEREMGFDASDSVREELGAAMLPSFVRHMLAMQGQVPSHFCSRGRAWCLRESDRAQDLERGSLTLHSVLGASATEVLSNPDHDGGESSGRLLRETAERALALGFHGPWVENILHSAMRHGVGLQGEGVS